MTRHAEVVLSRKAHAVLTMFWSARPGRPCDENGVYYPGPLGMIAFLNHFRAPPHVEAAVVIVSAELAGQPMLKDHDRLKNEKQIKQPLCPQAVDLAKQVGPNMPQVGRRTFTPYLHRLCQVMESRVTSETVLVVCALLWQFCAQIQHMVDVFDQTNPGWRELMQTLLLSLEKHEHPAVDLVSDQIEQLLFSEAFETEAAADAALAR